MNALSEVSLQGATEFRDIDPEERSDVRAIAQNESSPTDVDES